jgi:uncharacterized damage-inducible protein DinB
MNADAFRQLFDYHFSENRHLWEAYVAPLTDAEFTKEAGYSHGSVRNQVVHLVSVDDAWFGGLRGDGEPAPIDAATLEDRAALRAHWDAVEQRMRAYLAGLQDDMLATKPFADGEDRDLVLWQVLIHVTNHGTDHRAQTLRLLNDLDVRTVSQDYVFYLYDHP